jgi:hypothetical protein
MSLRVEKIDDKHREVGVSLMDSATYHITLGYFRDDEFWT